MIDLHCHLDLYPEPNVLIAECVKRRLYVLSVTTVPSAFEGTAALITPDGRIRTALGLHPELAAARAHELPLFERLLPLTRYVGEIGLDGSRDHRETLDTQQGVFADVLRICARAGGKVLSIHSRRASGIVLDALEAEPTAGKTILHWYLGSAKQVARAVEMGCWFSIGPQMLVSKRGRVAVASMPKDRVVPESDGPFGLVDGRPVLPWEAWTIVPKLAELWCEPIDSVVYLLERSFKSLLSGHADDLVQ
ncbi:MAG: Qat anti-phage system TatD family nuclease QatD [Geminicoccaceae bacterium]